MKCFMCSASIPDGVSTCPECGARIVSGGANETKATEKSWKELVNSSKMNEDEKSYLGRAYGSLYNLSICKIVMAVLCTIYGGTIDGAEAVNKSFPSFFEVLRKVGMDINVS